MLTFDVLDITVTRGITYEQEFRLYDAGYAPIPVNNVRSWNAAIYATDAIDGLVLATMAVSVIDDVDTTVLVSMPENTTLTLTGGKPAGYWYFWYVDDTTGLKMPIKKGKVNVE